MAAIYKVICLSQKVRGAEPSISTICTGFVSRRIQKKSIAEYIMAFYPPLEVIYKNGAIFKLIIMFISKTRRHRAFNFNIGFVGRRFHKMYCRIHRASYCHIHKSVLGNYHLDVYGGYFKNWQPFP